MPSKTAKPAPRRKRPRVYAMPPMAGLAAPLAPKTTEQEDLTTAGQRRVNLIWETTQAVIAIVVVAANMGAAIYSQIQGRPGEVSVILSSALFLVVGFYFSRTNHQAIGGMGPKPPAQAYQGR